MKRLCVIAVLSLAGTLSPAAENPYFQETTQRLDKGGSFFAFFGAEDVLAELKGMFESVAPMIAAEDPDGEAATGLIRKAFETSGIESLGAVGLSRARVGDDARRSRLVLAKGEGDGLMWQLPDQDVLPLLRRLPGDTVYAAGYSLRLEAIPAWIEHLVKGTPAEKDFADAMAQVGQMVDLPRALKSVAGLAAGMSLHETERIEVPNEAGEGLTFPKPGGIVLVRLREPYLFDFANGMLAAQGAPVRTSVVAGVEVRTMPGPPDTPFPVAPSWAMVEDTLAVAESKETLAAWIGGKGTLGATEEFQARSVDVEEAQTAVFLSSRFGKEMVGVQKAQLEAQDLGDVPPEFQEFIAGLMQGDGEFGVFSSGRRTDFGFEITTRETGSKPAVMNTSGIAVMAAVLVPAVTKVIGDAKMTEMKSNGRNIYVSVFADSVDAGVVGFPAAADKYGSSTAYFKKLATGPGKVLPAGPDFFLGLGQEAAPNWNAVGAANIGWNVVIDCDETTDAGVPFLISENLRIKTLGDDWNAAVDRGPPYHGKVLIVFHGAGAEIVEEEDLNKVRDRIVPEEYRGKNVLNP